MSNNYYFTLEDTYQIKLGKLPKATAEIRSKKTDHLLASLQNDGVLTIYNGYSWDGCTPRWCILGLFWIGIPNGVINCFTRKPALYYASLVHDCLGQMNDIVEVYDKTTWNRFFYELSGDFPLKKFYYFVLKLFSY